MIDASNASRILTIATLALTTPLAPVQAITEVEKQRAALEEILADFQPKGTPELNKAQDEFFQLYRNMYDEKMGDISHLKAQECRLNVELDEQGYLYNTWHSGDIELCDKVLQATGEIERFPLPTNPEHARIFSRWVIFFGTQ